MSDVSQSFALLKQASGDEMTDLVREFDKRLADPTKIPRGWRPIARELKQQLAMLARDDPDRVRGTLGTSTRFPLLAADVDDSVVAGVLRRANARALCACRVCGARASNLETSLPRGYCPRHSAVYWLIGLVKGELKVDSLIARLAQSTATTASSPLLWLPRGVLAVWLAHDAQSDQGGHLQAALSDGADVVGLDDFDAPRFRAWLKSQASALEQVRRQQERSERMRDV